MAERPEGRDRETWLAERGRVWRRRNNLLNVLMVLAIVALVYRSCL